MNTKLHFMYYFTGLLCMHAVNAVFILNARCPRMKRFKFYGYSSSYVALLFPFIVFPGMSNAKNTLCVISWHETYIHMNGSTISMKWNSNDKKLILLYEFNTAYCITEYWRWENGDSKNRFISTRSKDQFLDFEEPLQAKKKT